MFTRASNVFVNQVGLYPTQDPVDVTQYVISLEPQQVTFQRDSNRRYRCPEKACKYTSKVHSHMVDHYRMHTG